ncbi:fused MFS/spermidine synthase [Fimbriimonas ginsengisoli]|uniref:Polyamine aminopropyltransferase n=1 Tax=Fimbriimonas ginsengisoli Gsoil 348 TaxID=661478 RepID=A0A068NS15_FIMGI|nr:fused MFS/spermidine synthase [Fimbriimonas ginsengisoli]AIE86236.1 Spermidine synthase [Fimbriimonas ginsengisoli Gsoil 348]
MSSDATGIFINETHTSAAIWQYRVEKMILEGKTQFQTYQIANIPRFGKSLFLDYNIQTSIMDEYVFHECMSQPAMTLHPNPKKVLVCGGGEGATLREALKHNTVEKAVMVDIDEELVDMVKVHMPEWHQGAFEDPRTTLVHTDARQWIVDHSDEKFDVILSDLPNPHEDGPGQMLFTEEYFQICADAMSDDGVFAMQAGSANENYPACMASCIKTLESMEVFQHVAGYYGIVTTFFQPWGFVLASKRHDPLALDPEEIARRFAARGVSNRYYTPRFHNACFTLPEYLHRAVEEEGRILTDAEPFVWTA